MRTGKLSISRGHELAAAPAAHLSLVPRHEASAVAIDEAPVSPEYHFVHDRLAAIERLARLRDCEMISADEFAREKAIVFALPTEELLLQMPAPEAHVAEPARVRPPASLLGRLFRWKLVPVGIAAGLALSFVSQKQETLRFFDEALRLFGA